MIFLFCKSDSVCLARMVSENVDDEPVGARLEQLDDGIVERVLVLLQPAGNVVGYCTRVVHWKEEKILSKFLHL